MPHATVSRARTRYWCELMHVWVKRGYGFRWSCPNCLAYGTEDTKAEAYAALRDHTLTKHAPLNAALEREEASPTRGAEAS